jgi:methyl-accepting chemotaxis protein
MKSWKNLTIKTKLIVIISLSILITNVVVSYQSLYDIYQVTEENKIDFIKDAHQQKKDELKSKVDIAFNILKSKYKESQENNKHSIEEIKKDALKSIENIRYGNNGYFWINDTYPKVVMHPIKPSLSSNSKGTPIKKEC